MNQRPLAVLVLVGAFVLGAADTMAQTTRIEGERYDTLRGLAEYVDEGAQFALDEAGETLTAPGTRERALLTSLREFARQAKTFRGRIDQYASRPWRVDPEITRLRTSARRVNLRLRRVPAMRDTFEDWDLVLSDIADMQRVATGRDVDLRRPDPEWEPGHQTPSAPPTYGQEALRGPRLREFQELARELDAQSSRVHDLANRQRADYSQNGAQMLNDLQHFVQQAAGVRARTEANLVSPREIGPTVTHLLEDARKADTSMRNARVFMSVWTEWGQVIQTLEQMSKLVR